MRLVIAAVVFAAILASCTSEPGIPPPLVDADAQPAIDLAGMVEDLTQPPPPDLWTATDRTSTPTPDLAAPPDLWMCQPQVKPGPCGCPGLACCEENVQGHLVRFCAGKNTPTPDPAQRCFDPGAPTCLECGRLLQPCCFDGAPAQLSCRPGFECRQVKCARPDISTCFACDREACGLAPGSPCCETPPWICANGLQCQAGICR